MATTDLERSTFQNRPAYRYIRASDKLPRLDTDTPDDAADDFYRQDPIVRVKLFNPTGAGTWYLAAYDPETRTAFGAADIHEHELGYIDMAELVAFRGRFGLPIERDLHWTPRPLSECGPKVARTGT
jgi:hypothetical protein